MTVIYGKASSLQGTFDTSSESGLPNGTHRAIINILDRSVTDEKKNTVFLDSNVLGPLAGKWDGIPVVLAQDHPDVKLFDMNKDAALGMTKTFNSNPGRVAGFIRNPKFIRAGHSRIEGELAFDPADAEVANLIAGGRCALSPAFIYNQAKQNEPGEPVVPSHLLLFLETPTAQPADRGAIILQTTGVDKTGDNTMVAKKSVFEARMEEAKNAPMCESCKKAVLEALEKVHAAHKAYALKMAEKVKSLPLEEESESNIVTDNPVGTSLEAKAPTDGTTLVGDNISAGAAPTGKAPADVAGANPAGTFPAGQVPSSSTSDDFIVQFKSAKDETESLKKQIAEMKATEEKRLVSEKDAKWATIKMQLPIGMNSDNSRKDFESDPATFMSKVLTMKAQSSAGVLQGQAEGEQVVGEPANDGIFSDAGVTVGSCKMVEGKPVWSTEIPKATLDYPVQKDE